MDNTAVPPHPPTLTLTPSHPHIVFLVMSDVGEDHLVLNGSFESVISLNHLPTRSTLRENWRHLKKLPCQRDRLCMHLRGGYADGGDR